MTALDNQIVDLLGLWHEHEDAERYHEADRAAAEVERLIRLRDELRGRGEDSGLEEIGVIAARLFPEFLRPEGPGGEDT